MSGQTNNQISEYSELAQFVAEKFDEVKNDINGVKNEIKEVREDLKLKADKSDIDKIIATKADKSDIDRVLTRVTMLGDKIDDYRAEQLATKKQVNAHEKWIVQAAPKIGVKL